MLLRQIIHFLRLISPTMFYRGRCTLAILEHLQLLNVCFLAFKPLSSFLKFYSSKCNLAIVLGNHPSPLPLYSQCLASGQVLDVQYILRQYVNNIGIKTTGKKITSFHWRKALQRGTVSEVGKRKEDMKNVKFLCMNCFR